MIPLLIVALSVAADATAVSIAAAVRGMSRARGIALALVFGAAQSAMAAAGWIGGAVIGRQFSRWSPWIALLLLVVVGVRMIREAFEEEEERELFVDRIAGILMLAIATSLDSLGVGVSLPALGVNAVVALAVIGVTTFVLSASGSAFGRLLGARFGRRMEIAGGLALIAIGIRIVVTAE